MAKRKGKDKRGSKKRMKPEVVMVINPDDRLIVKMPSKGKVNQQELDDLTRRLKQLREGEIRTLVIPHDYVLYRLEAGEFKEVPEVEAIEMEDKKKVVTEDIEDADEKLAKVKDKIVNDTNTCKYCNKPATRNHARHDTGELEELCEDHYKEWHP